jgi:isocitrate/isopropylmalate dehydrogenase
MDVTTESLATVATPKMYVYPQGDEDLVKFKKTLDSYGPIGIDILIKLKFNQKARQTYGQPYTLTALLHLDDFKNDNDFENQIRSALQAKTKSFSFDIEPSSSSPTDVQKAIQKNIEWINLIRRVASSLSITNVSISAYLHPKYVEALSDSQIKSLQTSKAELLIPAYTETFEERKRYGSIEKARNNSDSFINIEKFDSAIKKCCDKNIPFRPIFAPIEAIYCDVGTRIPEVNKRIQKYDKHNLRRGSAIYELSKTVAPNKNEIKKCL